MRAKTFVLSVALCIATSGVANATNVGIAAVPTGWRLQNYVGLGIALWGAPAPECVAPGNTSKLGFASGTAANDINQFWAIMTAAIVAQHEVYVEYDNSTCTITSFGMDGT